MFLARAAVAEHLQTAVKGDHTLRIGAVHSEPNGGSAEAGGGLVKVLLSTLSESWLADVRAEDIALGSLDAGTSLILHTRNSE